MTAKFPIGIQDFAKLRGEGFDYVDKTSYVFRLAQSGRHCFLSRPRRFGKSLLLSTLEAFFLGRKELFSGLEVEQLEKDWQTYPVFHIDLSPENYLCPSDLEGRLNRYLCAWESDYGKDFAEVSLSSRFEGVISRAAARTGRRVVILVDEYDKPLLAAIGNKTLQKEFRGILKAFYGVLKSQDGNIRFSFLTGVTKFSKVSIFSDLNNLSDISRDRQYAGICGITQAEMETALKPYLEDFAADNDISYENALAKFRSMYDGYHFTSSPVGVYNPFSVFSALQKSECRGYWFETGTPSYLVKLIKEGNVVLDDILSNPVPIERLDGPDGDVIAVLFQCGYLTISGFLPGGGECSLDFPNDEVKEGFFKYLFHSFAPSRSGSSFEIGRFVSDLNIGDIESFLKRLQSFFADFDYSAQESPEAHYRNVLYILCKLLGLQADAEYMTSDGRIDLLVRTSEYVYVIECKLDGSADAALAQINDKSYTLPWACDGRSVVKVGMNFNSSKRRPDGWKIDYSGLTPQATPPKKKAIELLKVLNGRRLGAIEIMSELNISDRKYFREFYLAPSIASRFVLQLYPEKPTSPNQKYYVSALGNEILKNV